MNEPKNQQFDTKWGAAKEKKVGEEFSIFVPPGQIPQTQRQLFLYNYYQIFKRFLGDRKVRSTLEMGCGRGTISMYFNLYDRAQVSLFDISEDGVALAHKNFELHGARGEIFVADAKKVDLAGEQFDLVFSIGLLEHLTDYEKVIAEKYRLTRPGGMVISLNIPKKFSIQYINRPYRRVLKFLGSSLELKKDYFRNSDSPEAYKRAFEKAGFKNCKILHVAPFPIITPARPWLERFITRVYRAVLFVRALYKREPFSASALLGQAHFVVGEKA